MIKDIINFAMTAAFISYVVSALGYFLDDKPWMAATMGAYAFSIGTIYMAGGS